MSVSTNSASAIRAWPSERSTPAVVPDTYTPGSENRTPPSARAKELVRSKPIVWAASRRLPCRATTPPVASTRSSDDVTDGASTSTGCAALSVERGIASGGST